MFGEIIMGWDGNEYPYGRFEISTTFNLDMGINLNGELFNWFAKDGL